MNPLETPNSCRQTKNITSENFTLTSRAARTAVPYANTVVIKQMLFLGKFSHGDLLQMLIKQKTLF